MYTGWSALRSVVLCLLCTLGCATACDCNKQDLHSNLITYTKYMDMLNECFNNCQTRDYKVQVCAFIREHMQTVKECANVATEGKTMCEYCWPEDKLKASDPPPTPKTTQTPPKTLKVDSTQSDNPDAAAKPQSYFNMIIAAAVDNFITEFFSDVFTWIFGMFTEMYKIFTHFVFPFFLSCLTVVVCFVDIWRPGIFPFTAYYPEILAILWWVFGMCHLWFFGSYEYLDQRLFILTWARTWTRMTNNVNANSTDQSTHISGDVNNNNNNSQTNYQGPVNMITINLPQGAELPTGIIPSLQPLEHTSVRQLKNQPDSLAETSLAPNRSVKKDHDVRAARAKTPPVTQASVKKAPAVPAAPASAAASATPVVVSQHPPAGEPSMTPRNIFDTVCGFVKRVCVKPEQGVKRGRDADETPKDQPPDKKQKCTVAQLKNMLDNVGIKYPKSAKKADLMELAQNAGLL